MMETTTWLCADGRVRAVHGTAFGPPADDRAAAAKLHEMIYRPMGLLPPIVRWVSPLRRWAVLERPPTVITMRYINAKQAEAAGGKEFIFNIPLPWTMQLTCLDGDLYPSLVAVFALAKPIGALTDHVGILPLPNHYISGTVCPPDRDYGSNPTTVGEGLLLGHQLAWHGGFNTDTIAALQYAAKHKVPTGLFGEFNVTKMSPVKVYSAWERHTLDEVLSWDWPSPHGWGVHSTEQDPTYQRIDQLLTMAINEENELHAINPVKFYLSSAVAASV